MRSSNIIISNITLRDSPFWTLHTYDCKNVTISETTILAPIAGAPNTDGIDPGYSLHLLLFLINELSSFHYRFILSCNFKCNLAFTKPFITIGTQETCTCCLESIFFVILYASLIRLIVIHTVCADSCENVVIKNCYISVGDDGIAIKSGWDQYGISYGRPSANIIIQNVIIRSMVRLDIRLFSEAVLIHFTI